MKIIGIGETVYDIIFQDDQPQRAVPGGSTFNALISLGRTLGQEGTPISMITQAGDDHIGQLITSFMQQNHVSTDNVTVTPGTQSHISLAFLDSDRNAQYEFYKDHANAKLDLEAQQEVKFQADDIVLFGSFFAINPVLRHHTLPLFQAAHDAGAILYYDINFRKSHIKDLPDVMQNLEANMRLATVVRGSTEDFGYLYGTTDPREVYVKHISQHCPCFICTDGGGPVHLFAPNPAPSSSLLPPSSFLEAQIPSPRVADVVSTIGAGDNFNAGFIYGLAKMGIDRGKLATLPYSAAQQPCWLQLVACAHSFSSHVVQRIDNYVSQDYINTLPL